MAELQAALGELTPDDAGQAAPGKTTYLAGLDATTYALLPLADAVCCNSHPFESFKHQNIAASSTTACMQTLPAFPQLQPLSLQVCQLPSQVCLNCMMSWLLQLLLCPALSVSICPTKLMWPLICSASCVNTCSWSQLLRAS